MSTAVDHYTLLGVQPDADVAAIASAFRRRALQMHPDKIAANAATNAAPGQVLGGGSSTVAANAVERRMHQEAYLHLQQAYHVLSRADSRQQYDAALAGQTRCVATCAPVPCNLTML
jgi:curved DNA-binding protein CbpA